MYLINEQIVDAVLGKSEVCSMLKVTCTPKANEAYSVMIYDVLEKCMTLRKFGHGY